MVRRRTAVVAGVRRICSRGPRVCQASNAFFAKEEKEMAESVRPGQAESASAPGQASEAARVDWTAIEREPEFRELVRARRSFVIPATVFFLAWYMGFIVLTAVASDFMGERVYQGLTVGYCLALTQFVMVVVLGIWYLRKSDQVFDPLAERAISRYVEQHPDQAAGGRAEERFSDSRETVR
jgi:uncharacterized membrane protein (DUF485 family)